MSDNTSWLKKTGPYGRITLRRSGFNGPAPSFNNSSMTMQQLEGEQTFKRPPPRKSCLVGVDRKSLFNAAPKEKTKSEMRLSIAGRPPIKPVTKMPLKSDIRPSLRHPRQSYLPTRPKATLAPKRPTEPAPQETPQQVSSTPREPIHSILRSGNRTVNSSAAAKRVNFDGLDGVEPLQISEIEPVNDNKNVSKVDAATNTDPLPFTIAPYVDVAKLPEMMESMLSLCTNMHSLLSRFEGSDRAPTPVLPQRANPLKPLFLENLEDISEGNENVSPALNADPMPSGSNDIASYSVAVQTEASIQVETAVKHNRKSVMFSHVETHEFIPPDDAKEGIEDVPCKKARFEDNDKLNETSSSDSDEEPPAWPEPKFAVDITPSQARRSARLVSAASPARLLRGGHKKGSGRCTRNCC